MIALGRFIFKTRNALFPIMAVLVYIAFTPPAPTSSTQATLAVLILISGIVVRLCVIGFFPVKRDGDKKKAHADTLFTRGMFGLSRNPLYLGNLLIASGVFLFHGAWQAALVGIGLSFLAYMSLILSEEAYLSERFGDQWQEYRRCVPRLMLKMDNWAEATRGMPFSIPRAVSNEYNIILQALVTMALAIWYKSWVLTGAAALPLASICLLLAGLAFYLNRRLNPICKRAAA